MGLFLLLYAILLITPIPLPLVNSQVRAMVVGAMPKGSNIELGDMALALEGYVWPVIQFKPVVYTDEASGARVTMDALEVGFSPIRALVGQPGATVTVVRPYVQVSQDMFGPRLVRMELVPGTAGDPDTVRIMEGKDAFPEVGFSPEGVSVRGDLPPSALPMRSDNDWLIYNLEAAEDGLAQVVEHANQGRFSRLVVKDASV
ncbi:MAG TPA: hypothetical protein PK286_10945, partial [Devosia sp.]|nr:hypothetical protein [Devosia sp.]